MTMMMLVMMIMMMLVMMDADADDDEADDDTGESDIVACWRGRSATRASSSTTRWTGVLKCASVKKNKTKTETEAAGRHRLTHKERGKKMISI